jgi:hypothetical protein
MTSSNSRSGVARRAIQVCLLAVLVPAATADGQRKRPVREFTRQGILVANFAAVDGADMRLGRRAADAVRSRIARLSDRRELDVISGQLMALELEQGGLDDLLGARLFCATFGAP